jgi:hypothetical protein
MGRLPPVGDEHRTLIGDPFSSGRILIKGPAGGGYGYGWRYYFNYYSNVATVIASSL